ncbi:probable LRR receptor-like serine/threonine-protein kinase At3g47570 [Cornus florida]|uniref:probable LRR receptor-like serine/threonine-protein kinase At3g47570 n=1 Tax=Cornus florida TaxID=4283 RepID=UPI00289EDD40|nr:probable LRR receptor-like serine/threonine-protein kinase At3g47570 [Cornus florida]
MGSFGSVYRGKLTNGTVLATKVFNLQQETDFKSFETECEILRNIHHRNLTRVISSCSNLDFKALILDYMPNGSFEKLLYSHNYLLDILQRLDIMIDVACALKYLHHDYSTPVVHCDLKHSNVLLDKDIVAHVSDFGMAKFLEEEDSKALTKTLATIGYIAPGEIPKEIGNLLNLERLSMLSANLNDVIPSSIFNINSLKVIHLRDNNLRGVIPQEVGNLYELETIFLEFNSLTGLIRVTMFNISTLKEIGLVEKHLTDNLSSSIGRTLPNLDYLL